MKRKAKRITASPVERGRKTTIISFQNDNGFGTSMPPSFTSVEIYFDQKGECEIARHFFEEHELRQWKNETGRPIVNWKVFAAEWIYNYRQELKRKLKQSPFYTDLSN